jgi:hypothetical protein
MHAKKTQSEQRKERLAKALKANLARRKAKAGAQAGKPAKAAK